jgi:hypothetical protein
MPTLSATTAGNAIKTTNTLAIVQRTLHATALLDLLI